MTAQQLYALAMAKHFPRVELRRMTSGGQKEDWVGPGAVAWGLFADQMSAELIDQAGKELERGWAKRYGRRQVVHNR